MDEGLSSSQRLTLGVRGLAFRRQARGGTLVADRRSLEKTVPSWGSSTAGVVGGGEWVMDSAVTRQPGCLGEIGCSSGGGWFGKVLIVEAARENSARSSAKPVSAISGVRIILLSESSSPPERTMRFSASP